MGPIIAREHCSPGPRISGRISIPGELNEANLKCLVAIGQKEMPFFRVFFLPFGERLY